MTPLRNFVRSTFIGRLMLMPWRLAMSLRLTLKPVFQGIAWTFASREHYNLTYDLEPLNLQHLAAYLATITGKSYEIIWGYLNEIDGDAALKEHVLRCTKASIERHVADMEVHYGRRVGWYALVRAIQPRVIVETGVDKGLGTCVMAAALMRNAAEGAPGKVIGIDINPRAGYLLQAPYQRFGELVFGDSLEALRNIKDEVDLFIHDSVHTPEFEMNEFKTIQPKLSARAIVMSDNAHVTDSLLRWALANGRQFLFFGEKPKNHWWPGDGIGIAFHPTGTNRS
jgi:hypothetical protein